MKWKLCAWGVMLICLFGMFNIVSANDWGNNDNWEEIWEEKGEWYFLKVNEESEIKVRSAPSQDAEVLCRILYTVDCYVRYTIGDWGYTTVNGVTGWVDLTNSIEINSIWWEARDKDIDFFRDGSDLHYSEYILPESEYMYLSETDVSHLTKKGLRYARNEIYARHGRKFQSSELQEYFDSATWYKPEYEPTELNDKKIREEMNKYERHNVDLLMTVEETLDNIPENAPVAEEHKLAAHYTVELDGKKYTIPFKFSELLNDGWESAYAYDTLDWWLHPYEVDRFVELGKDRTKTNNGKHITIELTNYSDRMKRTKDCYVTVISTYLEKNSYEYTSADLVTEKGISMKSTKKEIEDVYGEPVKKKENVSVYTFDSEIDRPEKIEGHPDSKEYEIYDNCITFYWNEDHNTIEDMWVANFDIPDELSELEKKVLRQKRFLNIFQEVK